MIRDWPASLSSILVSTAVDICKVYALRSVVVSSPDVAMEFQRMVVLCTFCEYIKSPRGMQEKSRLHEVVFCV